MAFERFAIYFCPRPETALARFGEEWFGGNRTSAVPESQLAQPRRYGFHATLKPPFRLAQDATFEDLEAATQQLAADLPSVALEGLVLKQIGSFLALVPTRASAELDDLAFRCVRELDQFRAPLTTSEVSQRSEAGLSPRQEHLLFAWGYPYVGEEFRFHMTLTGPLTLPEMNRAMAELNEKTQHLSHAPIQINDLCICGDPGNKQPFHLVKRVPLIASEVPE